MINKTHFLALIAWFLTFNLPVYAQDYTELDCLVKPEMYIELSSPVSGVLKSVLVNKSDKIKRGQILAQLDDSVEMARLDVAKQEAEMDNLIKAKLIRLEYAQRKEQRVAGLTRDNALSDQEYDDAVTEVAIAKSELLQTKLDKKKNELKIILANSELQLKSIKSPINGIVVDRYLMPGESVNNQPILQLAKIDPLLVEVVAPFELFGLIKQGMEVEIRPDLPVGSQYLATVSVIDRIIDAASGSFSIRLALPNPDGSLIGGTKCSARFPVKLATRIPPNASSQKSELPADIDELPDDIKALLSSE